ncbi:Polysaccharide deacetylase [Paenibacillus sp. UNCCL117]|uniref:polysaccharide deacetylase family protein n=1 Tax=unclassified Paenibacillus TaxID=185978 RepID=UPI00087E3BB4|nr:MULTISPECIES: polysaccharide deacetylase family protein [unclassified Paenibacillus]SDC23988.1 Polysaccharide deacetylase [Paenibacillus sp. cl123]SFW19429.1 Polysaccharide deacetylase [Paenibacillus sp. UNCCL117]
MRKVLLCYPGGKHKALTLSYDDGRTADRRLVSILNRSGIKGTFHLNSGLFGAGDRLTEEEALQLYAGHEVSAHTLTHPTIARCSKEQLVYEFTEDRKNLERIFGYTVRGMSYPNGSFNRQIKEMLPYLGIEYARVVETTGTFAMPDDWLEWKPTCHHKRDLMKLAETFIGLHKQQYLYLMYVWGHSYEFDNDDNWELIEQFCEYAGGRDDIWYATNMEIYDYVQAFRQLKFSASQEFVWNPGASSVWLSVDGQPVEAKGGVQTSLL